MAWRPIRDAKADARFLNSVAALGAPDILRLELDVGPGPVGAHGQEPLARAGLLIVNPPHTLIEEARALLPWLAATLGRGGSGKYVCAWLDRAEVRPRNSNIRPVDGAAATRQGRAPLGGAHGRSARVAWNSGSVDLERQGRGRRGAQRGSRVWFTISHGIVNEIYYPRVDQACVRDLGLIVTDGDAFFAEVKRDCETVVERIEDGVPAFRLTSTHRGGRFRMINRVIADPRSDSIVLHIRLEDSSKSGLRVFSLLAPHLVNAGAHNNGQLGEYKGHEMLCAVGGGTHLAMLANPPFLARSVGFVGASDGWRQLRDHGRLTDPYDTATDGNVALSAELAMGADGASVLAVGFGRTSRKPPITR